MATRRIRMRMRERRQILRRRRKRKKIRCARKNARLKTKKYVTRIRANKKIVISDLNVPNQLQIRIKRMRWIFRRIAVRRERGAWGPRAREIIRYSRKNELAKPEDPSINKTIGWVRAYLNIRWIWKPLTLSRPKNRAVSSPWKPRSLKSNLKRSNLRPLCRRGREPVRWLRIFWIKSQRTCWAEWRRHPLERYLKTWRKRVVLSIARSRKPMLMDLPAKTPGVVVAAPVRPDPPASRAKSRRRAARGRRLRARKKSQGPRGVRLGHISRKATRPPMRGLIRSRSTCRIGGIGSGCQGSLWCRKRTLLSIRCFQGIWVPTALKHWLLETSKILRQLKAATQVK